MSDRLFRQFLQEAANAGITHLPFKFEEQGANVIQEVNNRDPRWCKDIDQAIEAKVQEAMELSPRLEVSSPGGKAVSAQEREIMLRTSFREIVKATSIDTLVTAPPALLEQLSVLALVNNENIKGVLVQVIRVYMMLWGTPETNEYAQKLLLEMESFAREKLASLPNLRREAVQWKPMPSGQQTEDAGSEVMGTDDAQKAPAKEPSRGLLMSMAMRYDHALGMPGYYDQMNSLLGSRSSAERFNPTHAMKLDSTLKQMRQIWEEVEGKGFYSPDKEAYYASLCEGVEEKAALDRQRSFEAMEANSGSTS